jgi:2-polyprenyl-3-methyl-5-hydroxy-6-metoxy-1,4-benzoquinol methylase
LKIIDHLRSLKSDLKTFVALVPRYAKLNQNMYTAYNSPESHERFGNREYLDWGLTSLEKELFAKHLTRSEARILVAGCSAGRECVPLAMQGHRVTGIDYVPEFIRRAERFKGDLGLEIEYLVGDVTDFSAPAESYDYILCTILCLINPRSKRAEMLKVFHQCLNSAGILFVNYRAPYHRPIHSTTLDKLLGFVNHDYTSGDCGSSHTLSHSFTVSELQEEVSASGFELIDTAIGDFCMAVMKKVG